MGVSLKDGRPSRYSLDQMGVSLEDARPFFGVFLSQKKVELMRQPLGLYVRSTLTSTYRPSGTVARSPRRQTSRAFGFIFGYG
jgi:hypothetical protein